MKKPIVLDEARRQKLLAEDGKGVNTFSNGTSYEGWADGNCWECWFWDIDVGGELCAFEAALMIGIVSPALALLFGWKQDEKYPDWWRPPRQCPFFQQRPDKGDDGDYPQPPPDPDPSQLVLIADPTEDLALANALEQNVDSPEHEALPIGA